jgi:protein SCO1/2
MNLPKHSNRSARRLAAAGAAVAVAALGGLAIALARGPAEDPHPCCNMPPPRPAWTRSTARYQAPDVELVRADGARVSLLRELDDGKPVILDFIYTTCTAICPVMSQTFAQIQRRLGARRDDVHLISISIDPDQDTPARLAAYARRFDAGPRWTFYTGTLEASVATQGAFDAYRGDKMNHVPVTFLRRAPGEPWVRLSGFAGADDVLKEYRALVAGEPPPGR